MARSPDSRETQSTGAACRLDRFAVAAALREIGALLALEGTNRFRARAYERGAHALEALTEDLGALRAAGRLTAVPGIGPALAATIRELCDTGGARLLERLRHAVPPGALELSRVLSLPRIRVLHDALGIDNLAMLRAACAAGQVRTVRGFGQKTEARILEQVAGLEMRGEKVLLAEAAREAEAVLDFFRRHPAVTTVELAGELRRRVEAVDRLDVVVAGDDPAALTAHAARLPGTVGSEQTRPADVVVHRAGALDVGVRVVAPDHFGAALVHATGTAGHVEKLAKRAIDAGLVLDEDGLREGSRPVRARSEAAVYRRLGLPFVPPELREDAGEIEAAADGTLPRRLLRLEDVRGLVHCHTVYSDGKHTVEQMARAADALGMQYLTITDHSQSATYAGGLDVERLRRQWDEIARVQETVRVRLLRGTESDILRDGSLDFPDGVLSQLDIVIASIHHRHAMTAAAMTRRLVRAMRHPVFKVWGHALGRYVLTRPPFVCHMDEVLDAIAASRAAIEVNGDPRRLDLAPPWIREARRRGIRFVVSTDAHSTNGLRNVRWGVDMARRGWLRREDVLNTASAEQFRDAVRP